MLNDSGAGPKKKPPKIKRGPTSIFDAVTHNTSGPVGQKKYSPGVSKSSHYNFAPSSNSKYVTLAPKKSIPSKVYSSTPSRNATPGGSYAKRPLYVPAPKRLIMAPAQRSRGAMRSQGFALMGLQGIRSPIPGFDLNAVSSSYGPRVNPVTGIAGFHTGIDIPVPMGTPVHAAVAGIVKSAVSGDSIYGNQVILDHGDNNDTMYGHMESYTVQPGERVKRGQIIGYVGSTGRSTGPHLHWEVQPGGQPVNPITYIGGS